MENGTYTLSTNTHHDYESMMSSQDVFDKIYFPGKTAVGFYLAFVSLFGTVGNAIVILLIYKTSTLRTPTYILILNLSVSDLIVSCFGAPMSCTSSFVGRWLYGNIGCNIYGFINYYCGCISLNSYAVIAIVRYLKVVRRSVGSTILKTHVVRVIYAVHVYTFIFTIPPLFGWNDFVLEGFNTQCDIAYKIKTPLYISYVSVIFIALFFIPLFIITFCYVRIVQYVSKHGTRLRKSMNRIRSRRESIGSSSKTTLMVLICIIVYLVTWLPYCIVAFWALFGDPSAISPPMSAAPALLAKASSIFNPWIFAGLNSQFRRALKV
uniref:Opsin 5 n=1 Tax=Amphiura filiformis TaxID=82378 RepID=A0A0A7KUZ5_9ECHI|nr:opsin 5 [Amphiura filiformis]